MGYLSNYKIGSLFITANAFRLLNNDFDIYYKVISLIYELNLSNLSFSLGTNEDDLLQGPRRSDDFISCTVDDFLKRFPNNFLEIQQRSILSLFRKYPKYGQYIRMLEEYEFFARDNTELGFIVDSLVLKGFLTGKINWNGDGTMHPQGPFKITSEGWLEIEKSLHKVYSNQVFIAMSFAEALKPVCNSIKKAIEDAGFSPVVMNEVEHIKYIPLEIQNQIKNCGYMVAELTTQNHGAYFEAGYAMGQNIPVIWCCKEDDRKNLHFDINQYNNILWTDQDDLYNRLKKRLGALKGFLEHNT
jgi:nucleoside 2-deoxyribosyltransferase